MNAFVQQFSNGIDKYWGDMPEEQREQLLSDIRKYANADPATFRRQLDEVMFDEDLDPLPVVMEALSEEPETWSDFFLDALNKIFATAEQSPKPEHILNKLIEFTYLEEVNAPFVQRIAEKLHSESNSTHLASQFAAIWYLPSFLINPSVRNKSSLLASLQQKLYDPNWKIRNVTFRSLGYENLVPEGFRLTLMDHLRKFFLGEPPMM